MSLVSHLEIRFADPVSALSMNENFVICGTMMGRIAMFSFKDQKTYTLAEMNNENITGIEFDDDLNFNIAIGDAEILRYHITYEETGEINYDFINFNNYESEDSHREFCDGSFPMLSNCFLLTLGLKDSNKEQIQYEDIKIRVFP